MMTTDTLRKLNELKLFGMAHGFDEQIASASAAHLSFEERMGLIVDQEVTFRDNRRLQRLLAMAKLRESACVEDIDYRASRNLDRSDMASLALCNWIRHGVNLIITGPTGGGSFRKRLAQLTKLELLILDDLGINTLTAQGRSDLLKVIEQRRGRKATLITSQLPVDKWHDYLSGGNPTVADAIMDRLVSGSHRIELKGDSMRKPRAAAKDKSKA